MSVPPRAVPPASSTKKRPRRIALVIMAVLLLAPVLAHPALAQYQEPRESDTVVHARSLNLLVPAVGELADGRLVGVTMTMQATIQDGSGGVFVDTRPLTQVDMQGSARLAASTATALAGATLRDHDFFITIRSDTTAVGGPSAGAAMTAAFTALLLDLPLRDDVVMTGMINPDGSIGPVGGILEKAEAAHRAGADLFLIPQGQGIVERLVSGGGFGAERRVEQVNVSEYAETRWGLEVREMADVYAAFEHATDHRMDRPEIPDVDVSPTFVRIMGEASAAQLEDAETAYGEARSRLDARGPDSEGAAADEGLNALLARARERLDAATASNEAGSHYSASSLVFQANLEIREVVIWLDALESDDPEAFITDYGAGLADRLDATSEAAADADTRQAATLEAIGAAQVRVLEARRLLAVAESAYEAGRVGEAVDGFAFSEERRRSVEWWLGLAREIDRDTEGADLTADIDDLSSEFRGIAQEALAYAEVLLGQTGVTDRQAGILQEAAANLGDARTAAEDGLTVGSLYLAIEARVGAHAALSLVGGDDVVGERLARQRDLAFIAVDQARRAGTEPFLAVSFLDFAETLSAEQPVEALLMYGNAAAIAATSGALASGQDCGFAGVPCRADAPTLTRVRVPGPDPWTAFFALATVLLGFMAGILVALVGTAARRRDHHEGDTGSRRAPERPPAGGGPVASAPRPRRSSPARHAALAAGNGRAAAPHVRTRRPHPSPAAPHFNAHARRGQRVATSKAK